MDFLSQPVWWVLLVGASILFGTDCGLGRKGTGNPVGRITRTGFFAVVAAGFILIGWQAGLVICFGAGLIGLLLALFIGRIMVSPVPATPARPVPSTRVSSPLGRRAILLDMMNSGVSREKVWGLIRQGSLVAYEDPRDHRIGLVRPEDLDALRDPRPQDEEQDRS